MREHSRPKQSNLLHVCLNLFTKAGHKQFSERIFFSFLAALGRKSIAHPHFFALRVIHSIRPPLTLKSKQVAGSKIRFPAPLPIRQQYLRAIRWLIEGALKRDRFGRLRAECLAEEFISSARGHSTHSRKQLKDTLRTLVENRAALKFLR